MNVQQLKNFDIDRLSIEELVALHADAVILQGAFKDVELEEPDWLTLNAKALRREIKTRTADRLEKRKMEIQASINALKTPTERKRELQAELQEVEAQLQD